VDSGAPVGPVDGEEATFLGEQSAMDPALSVQPSALSAESDPDSARPLPPMEDLVKRIPMPARDLMEELFRAKFITVKRMPPSALK
jgi:hypothetical protein